MGYRKNSHWMRLAVLLLFGGTVFLMLLMFDNSGAVIRGVTVGNLRIGKLTYVELTETLEKEAREFVQSSVLLVLPDNTEKHVPFYQLGVSLDSQNTILATYDVGRKSSFLGNTLSQIRSFIIGTRVPFDSEIQQEQLEEFVTEQLSKYHHPARNIMPVYNVQKNTFALGDKEEGMIIDLRLY